MDTLKCRKVLFVEGKEADYEEFVDVFGELCHMGFRMITRGLTVLQTGGATQLWPFDAIDAFKRLIGVDIQYVYLSDRDLLMDDQIAEREQRAKTETRQMFHLERRNRESYLLEPEPLSRLLSRKWQLKHPATELPADLTAQAIRDFILKHAEETSEATQTALLVQQEPRLRGDASHRSAKTQEVLRFFRQKYTEPIERREVPYALLDGKEALRAFRKTVADRHAISFANKEIAESFNVAEVASELKRVIDAVREMFGDAPEIARGTLF